MDEQKVIDVVEQQVETLVPEVVQTVNKFKNPKVLIAVAGVTGIAVGVTVGYHLAKRHLEPKYAAIAEMEIREARDHYKLVVKEGEYSTPEQAVQALIPESEQEALTAHRVYNGQVEVAENSEGVTIRASVGSELPVERRNIFVDGKPLDEDEWNQDLEVEQRGEEPYILSEAEFNENEPDYSDVSLTYFAKDDVLVDEKDDVVEDSNSLVGDRNLLKFGHGSKDKNMLYVRNPKLGLNIEIAKSNRSYAQEVLGFDDEETSTRPKRSPRGGDE